MRYLSGILVALGIVLAADAAAQYRQGEPEVLSPLKAEGPAPAPDPAPAFASAYHRAGQPRIVVLWNRPFDDRIASVHETSRTTTESTSSTAGSLSTSAHGVTGSAELSGYGSASRTHRVESQTSGYQEHPRTRSVSERNAALLEQAFMSELRRSGARLVDRALLVRRTAAQSHRGGADPRLVETDALLKHAEWLLEVQLIPDAAAPLGHAFMAQLKDLRTSREVMSVYSRAVPPPAINEAGRWIATEQGYAYQQPRLAALGAADYGAALAREVMLTTSQQLSSAR